MADKNSPLRNPLCIALDVDSEVAALGLAERLGRQAGGFKLGPRLIYKGGQALVQKISNIAPVFVDCKFFDIPSTMVASVRASWEAGASLATVHALAGEEALNRLAEVERELNQRRPFRILCVTILTSWGPSSLPSNLRSQPIQEHVRELAELTKRSGLNSIVCSAGEMEILKDLDLFMATPGIRFPDEVQDDQKRISAPQQAIANGSSVLVVGRPIIEAADPELAMNQYLKAIQI